VLSINIYESINGRVQVDINKWRLMHLAAAEAVDAWRIVPRAMVTAYGYLLAYMIHWYMGLKPYVIEACVEAIGSEAAQKIAECVVDLPGTQHTALLTAVIGISAGVFGFYANTGRNWSNGAHTWPTKPVATPPPPKVDDIID
jgi:hypothetical protein